MSEKKELESVVVFGQNLQAMSHGVEAKTDAAVFREFDRLGYVCENEFGSVFALEKLQPINPKDDFERGILGRHIAVSSKHPPLSAAERPARRTGIVGAGPRARPQLKSNWNP